MGPSSSSHLGVRDHGGSFHPLLGGGLGSLELLVPAALIRSPSQGGCQGAAGPRGEAATGLEAHGQHGRGAVPGAAAAVR